MKIQNIVSLLILFLIFSCGTKSIAQKNQVETLKLNEDIERKQDSLAFELCQIYGLDQGIRHTPGFPNIWKLVIQPVDTLNFNKVIAFIRANGFPTKELIGEKNLRNECVEAAMTAVLLHNPHRLVNEKEYFDLFVNEIEKGRLNADFLANVLDKYYWTKSKNKTNRRVFYGSQFGKPCIQTKEATNKARIEIGLKPLVDSEFVDCAGEILEMPNERK